MTFKLLIWDCDGCLIDSEVLANDVEARILTNAGYPIEGSDLLKRFAGVSSKSMFEILKNETDIDFEPIFDHGLLNQTMRAVFVKELKKTVDIQYALDRINLPMCIASSSDPDRLQYSLTAVGLYNRFEGRIYSSTMVAKGKPAPDLFLYVAAEMNVDAKDCLVIEDSIYGIRAAHAAEMTVFGYTGASHGGDSLHQKLKTENPAAIFSDMRKLPDLIKFKCT